MTNRKLFPRPSSSAAGIPRKGFQTVAGPLERSELFHGGPPVRFRRGRWYLDTPRTAGASEHQAGRRRGHRHAVSVAPAVMLPTGRSPKSATGVTHKRPCGWSFGDRLRAHVDNPERRRRHPEVLRSQTRTQAQHCPPKRGRSNLGRSPADRGVCGQARALWK